MSAPYRTPADNLGPADDPKESARLAFETYHERVSALSGVPAPHWNDVSDVERNHWRAAVVASVGVECAGLEAEIELLPNSRERSLAKTKAEEARLWMTKAARFEVIP